MNVVANDQAMSRLTDQIRHSVDNPLTSTDFDFTAVLDDVLSTVGLSATDAGGNVRFYGGADPLIASPFLFASASAVALAAKAVAASAIWRERGGDEQHIAIDIGGRSSGSPDSRTGAGNRSTDGRRRCRPQVESAARPRQRRRTIGASI